MSPKISEKANCNSNNVTNVTKCLKCDQNKIPQKFGVLLNFS